MTIWRNYPSITGPPKYHLWLVLVDSVVFRSLFVVFRSFQKFLSWRPVLAFSYTLERHVKHVLLFLFVSSDCRGTQTFCHWLRTLLSSFAGYVLVSAEGCRGGSRYAGRSSSQWGTLWLHLSCSVILLDVGHAEIVTPSRDGKEGGTTEFLGTLHHIHLFWDILQNVWWDPTGLVHTQK